MKKRLLNVAVSLLTAVAMQATTLWENADGLNPGWWDKQVNFDASQFAQTKAGDQIVITIKETTADWGCNITLSSQDGSINYYYSSDTEPGILGSSFNAGVVTEPTDYAIDITADLLSQIQQKGLCIWGGEYVMTKVVLTGEAEPADNSVLWENADGLNPGWWDKQVNFDASQFAQTKAGDQIVITIKETTADWGCNITLSSQDGSINYYYSSDTEPGILGSSFNAGVVTEPTDYAIDITADLLTQLQQNGLCIWGGEYVMTKLCLNSGSETTVIGMTNDKPTSDTSVYTLSGLRVAKATKGLYIVNGKKVVIK